MDGPLQDRPGRRKAPARHTEKQSRCSTSPRSSPDDTTAEAWFAEQRWGDTPACPYCGSERVLSGAAHKTMPYRCREKECRKRFSVRTGTVMQVSNLGYRKWAIALYLVMTSLKSVSPMKLHRLSVRKGVSDARLIAYLDQQASGGPWGPRRGVDDCLFAVRHRTDRRRHRLRSLIEIKFPTSPRVKFIVPVAVEFVSMQRQSVHLCIRRRHPFRVFARV